MIGFMSVEDVPIYIYREAEVLIGGMSNKELFSSLCLCDRHRYSRPSLQLGKPTCNAERGFRLTAAKNKPTQRVRKLKKNYNYIFRYQPNLKFITIDTPMRSH